MNTIQEVVDALEKIVFEAKNNNLKHGYFAVLYLQMTKAVQKGIINNRFQDGIRMEKLDIIFASRYIDALNAWQREEKCSASWQIAFDETKTNNISVLQHMLCGINAHINLDLGIAAAETSPGESIENLKADFEMINTIISGLVDTIQERINTLSCPMRFIDKISGNRDETVANFSIGIARKASWTNAVNLTKLNENNEVYIQELDKITAQLAKGIIKPGFIANLVLKPVKWFERGSVKEKMEVLEGK